MWGITGIIIFLHIILYINTHQYSHLFFYVRVIVHKNKDVINAHTIIETKEKINTERQ